MSTGQIARQVVELRIHGVNNASPESMLESDPGDAVPVEDRADGVAGFFRRKDVAGVEHDVVREAYRWGGLARLSGRWLSIPVLSAFVRVGWVLLLPFGLANVAYWSRPLDNGQLGRGAVSMRLFGLGLTVLLVSTMCTVTMDLYSLQCYSGGDFCRFDLPLSGLSPASRVAVASLLPMAVLGGLWLLTRASRARYEEYPPKGSDGADTNRESVEPARHQVLARCALWRGGAMVGGLSCLHVAAGSAVVVIASSWPALIGPGTSCRTLGGLVGAGCIAQRAGLPPLQQAVFGTTAVLALLVLATVVALVVLRTADAPDVKTTPAGWTGPATTWVFIAALALYGAQLAALQLVRPALATEGTAALPGSNAVPTLEVAFLVSIAVAGLAWRSRVRFLPEAFGAAVGLGLLATHLWPGLGLSIAALGGLGVAALLCRRWSSEHPPLRRTAPGVLLGVSLLVAIGFSAVALLGTGYVLNRGASASNLLRCDPAGPAAGLCAPRIYVWGGTSVLVAGTLTGLLVAVLLVLALVRSVPGDAATPAVQRSRRWAALLHRAEPMAVALGFLGLLAGAVAVAGAAMPPTSWKLPADLVAAAAATADWSVIVLALAAVVVMVSVVARSLGTSSTRPLGLVWDLLCFLPRAVHPFAPPCYAERAVPELADRIRSLVREGHLVVLSAHSLGAVLAVAAYFRLDEEDRRGVRLLTYGAQLRPYFGRLFPDLFGPQVLGTQPCSGARLWTADPWSDDRQPAASAPRPTTLLGELGTGWLSLWRQTDPLGFPVRAYPDNDTDRRAAELLPDNRVQTHGDYSRTTAYADALVELQMGLRQPELDH
jgi:hypothetical protein